MKRSWWSGLCILQQDTVPSATTLSYGYNPDYFGGTFSTQLELAGVLGLGVLGSGAGGAGSACGIPYARPHVTK